MSERQVKKNNSVCADDEEEMSCKNGGEVECCKCKKHFCYSHVIGFESWMEDSNMEEGDYCRGCIHAEMVRLDEENSSLKGDVKDLVREKMYLQAEIEELQIKLATR